MKNLRNTINCLASVVLWSMTLTATAQDVNNETNNFIHMKNIQASSVPVTSPDCQHVKIPRGSFDLAANVYLPIDFTDGKTYPAIVVSHPGGGVNTTKQSDVFYFIKE